MFEAGALTKARVGSKLIPLLFDLEISALTPPLSQFQAKKFDQQGLSELVKSLNSELLTPVSIGSLDPLLKGMWPGLLKEIESLPSPDTSIKISRDQTEVLEELVAGVRGLEARSKKAEMAFPGEWAGFSHYKPRLSMPIVLKIADEFKNGEPLGLLVFSGLLREDFPWLSEVLSELYRNQLEPGDIERSSMLKHAKERIRSLIKLFMSSPLADLMGYTSEQRATLSDLYTALTVYLVQIEIARLSSSGQATNN